MASSEKKTLLKTIFQKNFRMLDLKKVIPELDHAGDIDYLGWVGKKAFGIQIKPITSKSNFGNYSATERMKMSFTEFSKKFVGKVFIIYSESEKK